ncbi:MAG: hypothetical protein M1511_11105 [Deltaproteobacteria bacterium]|nr:hypothetical protein [Deltaproteobacteria bacterium]
MASALEGFVILKFIVNQKSTLQYVILLVAFLFVSSCGGQSGRFVSTVPPAPPTSLSFKTTDQGLLVSWRPVPEALKYTLFWGPEKSEFRRLVESKSPAVLIKGIPNGVLNYFAVTSSSAHVESQFSHELPFIYDTDPKNAPVHLQKAQQLAHNGNLREALVHISAAINLDSSNPVYYRERAKLRDQLGLTKAAKNDLEIAEKLYMKKRLTLKQAQVDSPEND